MEVYRIDDRHHFLDGKHIGKIASELRRIHKVARIVFNVPFKHGPSIEGSQGTKDAGLGTLFQRNQGRDISRHVISSCTDQPLFSQPQRKLLYIRTVRCHRIRRHRTFYLKIVPIVLDMILHVVQDTRIKG